MPATFPVYIEVGTKRVFASALNWPGWTRAARTEGDALAALFEYGPRYAKIVTRLAYVPPKSAGAFTIEERVKGDATTDFGAPSIPATKDGRPIKADELTRLVTILERCWSAFDDSAAGNARKKLQTGPRGGGRQISQMVDHVNEADRAYLGRLGVSSKARDPGELHETFVEALKERARGEEPPPNPRRKAPLWVPRYAIRRSAWHALDHAWEIEDRSH
ncbi:MAG TPA: hypothetical protein VKV69_11110 [Actinomycetota bacterium]|nr:hypothetical protein [Actinomycetota bacterium]